MRDAFSENPDASVDSDALRQQAVAIANTLATPLIDQATWDSVGFDAIFHGSDIPMHVVRRGGLAPPGTGGSGAVLSSGRTSTRGSNDVFAAVNDSFARLLRRGSSDIIGMPWSSVVHEVEHGDESDAQSLTRYQRGDGTIAWCWLTVITRREADGAELRLGQLIDVTAQVEAVGKALVAHRQLDDIGQLAGQARSAPDAVLRVRSDGTVEEANDVARTLFGFEQPTDHRLDEILFPVTLDRVDQMMTAAIELGRSQQIERQRLRVGGSLDDRWYVVRVVPDLHDDGSQSVHLVFADVTGGVESERRLTELALTDPLTGLANRTAVDDRLSHALQRIRRHRGSGVAVLAIDLDNFKSLNDVYGHAFGDQALVQFADLARSSIREIDTVGRIGGDEFLVILEDVGVAAARATAERIDELLNPFTAEIDGELAVEVSLSTGMAWTAEPMEPSDLVSAADERLMLSKRAGRGRLWLPDDGDSDVALPTGVVSRRALIAELSDAIDSDQFVVHYQPLVDRASSVVAVEALIRWDHPQRGLLAPDAFVPLLIETGQIGTVGTWVMETAIEQVAEWRRTVGCDVRLNINASAGEIGRQEYRRALERTLANEHLSPNAVSVELTEQALSGTAVSDGALQELTSIGVRLVLDDFGTGISSLAHLRTASLTGVKIDRSFVSGTLSGDIDRRIARGVTQLAHEVGVEVTAEGVETAEQSAWIRSIGCDFQQGYYFGRPVDSETAAELVAASAELDATAL